MKYSTRIVRFLLCAVLIQISPGFFPAWATDSRYQEIETQWGGHFKVAGRASWPDDDSWYESVGNGPYYDGNTDFRLKNRTYFAKWVYFDAHYETVLSGGDTWRKTQAFKQLYPNLELEILIPGAPINDDLRLMDLTKIIDKNDSYVWYHRLDRLSVTLLPEWGVVRVGRQALTWGNGLLFNPMDLFNPFAPTDIDRDYKTGDDMVLLQLPADNIGDVQFLYVPRRNPENNHLEFDQSSIAGKLHVAKGTTEYDIMVAKHYKDAVIGLGCVGYFMDAAWRLDATYTFLHNESERDGFFSLAANMDYSWIWLEKNFYGLIEFYYNGLGTDAYSVALTDHNVYHRFLRGELYTLGKYYLGGTIQVELHPLLNFYLTVINNMSDPSGILQPRIIWDVIENLQLTCGGNIYYGATGTEYGGYKIPGIDYLMRPPDNAFLWLTYFF
jgi:hypothetical protein